MPSQTEETQIDTLWDAGAGKICCAQRTIIFIRNHIGTSSDSAADRFLEVGGHNIYRLRGADWNDALDMASEHGESVALPLHIQGIFASLPQ